MRPITGVWNNRAQADWMTWLAREVETLQQKTATAKTEVVIVVERKDRGVNAGGNDPRRWSRRNLNRVQFDTGKIAAIHNGKLQLKAGIYEFMVSVPAVQVNGHQARVVVGNAVWLGTSECADSDVTAGSRSVVVGRMALPHTTVVTVEHWTQKEKSRFGLGKAGDFGEEIYTIAEFRRIGDA